MQGHDWTGTFSLSRSIDQPAKLVGDVDMTFSSTGRTVLHDIELKANPGKYILQAVISTDPADYTLQAKQIVEVLPNEAVTRYGQNTTIEMKFTEEFSIIQRDVETFLVAVYNRLLGATDRVGFSDMNAWEGIIHLIHYIYVFVSSLMVKIKSNLYLKSFLVCQWTIITFAEERFLSMVPCIRTRSISLMKKI